MRRATTALLVLAAATVLPCCSSSSSSKSPPGAVGTFTATVRTSARIDLDWTAATDTGEYRIERRQDAVGTWSLIATVPGGATSYEDHGLLPGTDYSYRITPAGAGLGATFDPPAMETTLPLAWSGPYAGGPSARGGMAACYDSVGQRMIVMGGGDGFLTTYDTVHTLDLSGAAIPGAWGTLASAPSGRELHSMVFDPLGNRVVVFGGLDPALPPFGDFTNETLILDLGTNTWSSPVTPPAQLLPRYWHSAVYDPVGRRMIVFGGQDALGNQLDDTWSLSLVPGVTPTWTQIFQFGPPKRSAHTLVYSPDARGTLLFGGSDNDLADGSVYNSQTWKLGNSTFPSWTLYAPTQLDFRLQHMAVYDELNRRMVVFGGTPDNGATVIGGVIALRCGADSGVWSLLTPAGGPGPRMSAVAVYDPVFGRMVLYGGTDDTFTLQADTWALGL